MATTTTNYGWDIPQSTDLVKDGATAIATLGQDIDTSIYTALGGNKSGLVLLNTTSFSGVSSFSLAANTFSSTYNDYLVLVNFTASSTNLDISLRMRAAGVDNSSAVYDRGGVLNPTNAGLTGLANIGQVKWDMGTINTTYPTYSQWQFIFKSPNTSNGFKSNFATGTYANASNVGVMWWSNNVISSTTQFDSASWIASTGNFTGNYSVYGFNK